MGRAAAVVRVLVLALALAALGAGCGSGDDRPSDADLRSRQARSAAAEAGLPDEVGDLLALAARAPAARFAATYAAGSERVVVHQVPPRRRVDVVVGGVARESVVVDDAGSGSGPGSAVACSRPEGSGWSCEESERSASAVAGGPFSPELVARTVDSLQDSADAYDVVVTDREVAGVAARCLVATPRTEGSPSELCVAAASGVPLLVDLGDGSPALRAVTYRPTASDDDVRRPDRTG